jgi:hypothetical protein
MDHMGAHSRNACRPGIDIDHRGPRLLVSYAPYVVYILDIPASRSRGYWHDLASRSSDMTDLDLIARGTNGDRHAPRPPGGQGHEASLSSQQDEVANRKPLFRYCCPTGVLGRPSIQQSSLFALFTAVPGRPPVWFAPAQNCFAQTAPESDFGRLGLGLDAWKDQPNRPYICSPFTDIDGAVYWK